MFKKKNGTLGVHVARYKARLVEAIKLDFKCRLSKCVLFNG